MGVLVEPFFSVRTGSIYQSTSGYAAYADNLICSSIKWFDVQPIWIPFVVQPLVNGIIMCIHLLIDKWWNYPLKWNHPWMGSLLTPKVASNMAQPSIIRRFPSLWESVFLKKCCDGTSKKVLIFLKFVIFVYTDCAFGLFSAEPFGVSNLRQNGCMPRVNLRSQWIPCQYHAIHWIYPMFDA